jgi:MFS family permease
MLQAEHSALAVGLVQSCYFVGFILGAFALGPLVGKIGSQRAFIGFGSLAALAALGYLSFDAPGDWAVLRLITGFCMVGIFTSIESGVNGAVVNEKRGRAFSLYLVLTYLGVSSGQMLLGLGPQGGDLARVLVNVLYLCSLIPVALIGEWKEPVRKGATSPFQPTLLRRAAALLDGLRELLRTAPRSVPACIGTGLLSSAFYALTPVYLARSGNGERCHRWTTVAVAGRQAFRFDGQTCYPWSRGARSRLSVDASDSCTLTGRSRRYPVFLCRPDLHVLRGDCVGCQRPRA